MRPIMLAIALLIASPGALGQELTEVMYDPDGADSDREWVEIMNTHADPIDIETYYLLENSVFHGITGHAGSTILATHDVTVIADDPVAFLVDYPGYEGNLAKASFSLSNTGEEIALADGTKTVVDSLLYSPLAPSGVSLVRIDDRFEVGVPGGTPGSHATDTIPAPAVPEFSSAAALLVLIAGGIVITRTRRPS